MREINIDLSSDKHWQQQKIFGGYAGEHNETILLVKLPKRMVDIKCSGYRFDFQTSSNKKISSPLIPVSELQNDILSFHLTEQFTIAGNLLCQIAAILSDGNKVSLIAKTNTVILCIKDSPDGIIQLIDPNGYKDELQKMIDERIMEMSQTEVLNFKTRQNFPNIGDANVIYKAENEAKLYQWNSSKLIYEPLDNVNVDVNINDIEIISGGEALDLIKVHF